MGVLSGCGWLAIKSLATFWHTASAMLCVWVGGLCRKCLQAFVAFLLGRLGTVEEPRSAAAVAMLVGRPALSAQESRLALAFVSFHLVLHRAAGRDREKFYHFIATI